MSDREKIMELVDGYVGTVGNATLKAGTMPLLVWKPQSKDKPEIA